YLSSTCYLTLSRFQSPESNSEFNINIQRDQNGHFIKIMITVDKVDTEIENGTISVDGQSISLPYDQKTIHIHKYGIFTRLQSRRGFLSVFWETQGSITDKTCRMIVSEFFINFCIPAPQAEAYENQCAVDSCNLLSFFFFLAATPSCPGDMIFTETGPALPPTCSNPSPSDITETISCQCPDGTIVNDLEEQAQCVPIEQCPCEYNGVVYQSGESRESLCESCLCRSGKWECVQENCTSRCKIESGSFFTTFDGRSYTVNGICTYVIATVSMKNKCYHNMHVRLLNYMLHSDVAIFWQSSQYIYVQTSFAMKLQVQIAPVMQLYVTLPVEAKGLIKGLCGNYNDIVTDEFMASSGILEPTADSFAMSWATQSEQCQNIFPECTRSDYGKFFFLLFRMYIKHILIQVIINSSIHFNKFSFFFPVPQCPSNQVFIYNMVSCNHTCQSLSEYDISCDVKGHPVDGCGCLNGQYMNDEGTCVSNIECPCYYKGKSLNPGMTQINGYECFQFYRTCSSNVSFTCVSGCYCQDGFYKDNAGNCVPLDQCPCMFGGQVYNSGDSVQVDCNTCICMNASWSCTHNDCPGKCQVYGDGHYQTFDMKWYSFDGNCEYTFVEDYCGNLNGTFRITVESVPCCEEALTCSRAVKITFKNTELVLRDLNLTEKTAGQNTISEGIINYSVDTVGLYLIHPYLCMDDFVFFKILLRYNYNIIDILGDTASIYA
uniref:VWFD domain-containing protein n=1 Tax=Erpetoichthys calabaricus TaxID=27687 RepID=A0A8C4RF49_ERPCA